MTAADLIFVFSALISLGAALGAVGITMGELFYAKATADNTIVECEKEYIRATFWSLRWGMSLVLLSSIGLIVTQYFAYDAPQDVLTTGFWMILTLAVCIIFLGFLLSRNLVPWWFGSAAAFTSWWGIFSLTVWRTLPYSYMTMLFTYLIAVFLMATAFLVLRPLAALAAKHSFI